MSEPKIVNVVATADLRQKVDLIQISKLPHTIHDPEIYGGRVAYLKTPNMHGKVTIFPSGKLISVGSKSREQAQTDLDFTVETLISSGLINPIMVDADVRNIVAVTNVGRSIDLKNLAESVNGIYEPEQFPGMIIKNLNPKATYLVFSSGKVIITGCINEENLYLSAKKLVEILNS